jgi:predicted nucleotidyltransferase
MPEVIDRLEKVAQSLSEIINRLLFVGGGVTELLVTDSAGRKPRPTEDVDCIIEVASLLEYHHFEKVFRKSGFRHDSNLPPLICRWEKDGLILDVMPTLEGILGFTNRWYKDAIQFPVPFNLPSGKIVNIVHPVFYVATKTEAFHSRGKDNYFTSHDFEDIVSIVNGREALVDEMKNASQVVFNEMQTFWQPRLDEVDFKAALQAHLDAYEDTERSPIVLERFRSMFVKY